jgi:hypothetical protein
VNPTRLPQLGSVVWAELEDTNGFCKLRPAVVVTATVDIAANQTVRVAAITTRLSTPLPDDYVLLPWDRQGKAARVCGVNVRPLPPGLRRSQSRTCSR